MGQEGTADGSLCPGAIRSHIVMSLLPNILKTPMPRALSPPGSRSPTVRPRTRHGVSAGLGTAGAGPASRSACRRGKYLLYFSFADFVTGSYSQQQ